MSSLNKICISLSCAIGTTAVDLRVKKHIWDDLGNKPESLVTNLKASKDDIVSCSRCRVGMNERWFEVLGEKRNVESLLPQALTLACNIRRAKLKPFLFLSLLTFYGGPQDAIGAPGGSSLQVRAS